MMSALLTLMMMMFSMKTTGHSPKQLSQDLWLHIRPIHSFDQHFPAPTMCQELHFYLDIANGDLNPEGSQAMVSLSQWRSG